MNYTSSAACAPLRRDAPPIRVMVVDDSAVARGLISRLLTTCQEIEVACTAANGEIALRELERQRIDVVVLDIEMPVMDGLTALARMAATHPGTRVIMVSTLTERNAEVSLRALQMGASDYVPKPNAGLTRADDFQRELIDKVLALGAARPASRPTLASVRSDAGPFRTQPAAARGCAPQVLAVGASTGGPPALLSLFESLKGAIRQPILLTQHIPANFTAMLAEQLSRAGDRPCAEARDGETIEAGRVYVAPGGWHMVVARRGALPPVIQLNQEPPENFCRPAVDPMLRSVAQVYGSAALAVILTGMGADGARGCEAIAKAGGRFIVQDEATSVVWGMPGAAAGTGLAEAVLPLEGIGPWLRRNVEAPR